MTNVKINKTGVKVMSDIEFDEWRKNNKYSPPSRIVAEVITKDENGRRVKVALQEDGQLYYVYIDSEGATLKEINNMTKEKILNQLKKRLTQNESKLQNLQKEKVILIKAEKENAEKVLIPMDNWASLQIDGKDISNQLSKTLSEIEKTILVIDRYKKDIISFDKNETLSDKTKSVLLKRYEFLKENHVTALLNAEKSLNGIVNAHKNNITNRNGSYYYNGQSVSKSYYNEFIEKENESIIKIKNRLNNVERTLNYIDKL